MNLTSVVNKKIFKKLKGIDKSQQLQSVIHKDLNFKRNSINLLISRRGVGKTFNVMRELIKLSELPDCGNYTQFIYITDKTSDCTVNELIKLIKLKTHVVKYDDATEVLQEIMDAKTEYDQIIKKDIEDDLDKKYKQKLFKTIDVDGFYDEIPNSAILMDDAMNILNGNKYKMLRDLIFQNGQPRFTIFICVQDLNGVPASIKRNIDTIWFFAGFTDKICFGFIMNQIGCPYDTHELYEKYIKLEFRDALIFEYENGVVNVKINKNGVNQDLDL
jgi:hypothetical protein